MMKHIKSGDRVWVGTERYGTKSIRIVSRVTPTQIVIDWNGNGSYLTRYKRDNGYAIGAGYLRDNIMRVATPAQCAKWDAKQLAEQEAREREEARQQALESIRLELAALFGDSATVSKEQWGNEDMRSGKWTVEFHFLTEDGVRELAARWAKAKEQAK